MTKIPGWVKNKYVLALTGFMVWMLFFDQQDIITTHFRQKAELQRLTESRIYYEQEIRQTQQQLDKLQSDPELLEKIAREKYRMKKADEDLFIVP